MVLYHRYNKNAILSKELIPLVKRQLSSCQKIPTRFSTKIYCLTGFINCTTFTKYSTFKPIHFKIHSIFVFFFPKIYHFHIPDTCPGLLPFSWLLVSYYMPYHFYSNRVCNNIHLKPILNNY